MSDDLIMVLNTRALGIAQRLNQKHGQRASELYTLAARGIASGDTPEEVETLLDEICDIAGKRPIAEVMKEFWDMR